jgi:Leucine-rich repeat (LRR) protein
MRQACSIPVCCMMFLALMAHAEEGQGHNQCNYHIKDGKAMFYYDATDQDLAVLDNHPEISSIEIGVNYIFSGDLPDPPPHLPLTDGGFAHIANCPKLEELRIGTPLPLSVTDNGLKILSGLTELRRLEISCFGENTPFTDEGIKYIAPLVKMEELWLDFNKNLTDKTMTAISGMKELRVLRFYGAKITDAGLEQIQDLTKLKELLLGKSLVSDSGLKVIGRFSELKELDLQFTKITDEGMPNLSNLKGLNWLAIPGTKVSGKGLECISKLTGLKFLDLKYTRIDDAGLANVENLTNLESLDISNTKVTDTGLKHLSKLKKIKCLYLEGLPITNEGVKALNSLSSLTDIEIIGTKITGPGRARLKNTHPHLEFRNNN